MAFLVCYSISPPDDHARQKAIYLNQLFYEIIYSCCRADGCCYVMLSELASLRYKSPVLVIGQKRIDSLIAELSDLEQSGQTNPQIQELINVCAKAKVDGCGLTISGDMYPEL